MEAVRLQILGMHCAGCVGAVEKAVRAVAGVREASVDLLRGSAVVHADAAVAVEELIGAIRRAGYDARLDGAGSAMRVGAEDAANQEAARRNRQALVQAIALVAPILALEHLRHVLWGPDHASQLAARMMEFVLLAMLAVSPAGGPILASGLRSFVQRAPNMDALISMGFLVASASSVIGVFIVRDESFVHLHAAAMILGLVCVGRYLEGRARHQAAGGLTDLARAIPKTAMVRREARLVETPAEDLREGDVVCAGPHMTIPADGIVQAGKASIDERLLTGEPMPVAREAGEAVKSGTVVVEGEIDIGVTATGEQATVGRITRLVMEAQSGKTKMQRLADRIAGVFTPLVMLVAAGVFAWWWLGGGLAADAARAAIAVLVVACPCALGLATPAAVAVASGAAARRGILVRDAAMLEAMAHVKTVVWDKTGTITTGAATVAEVRPADGVAGEELIRLAASAGRLSPHPLAQAIVTHAAREGVELVEAAHVESVPGAGLKADVAGRQVLLGRLGFLEERGVDVSGLEAAVAGTSAIVTGVAVDGKAAGFFEISDPIRPGASETVQRLRDEGIESEMLSGDREQTAREVAEQVGIRRVWAEQTPDGKVARIRALKETGAVVAMVGDGINDAAALAAADVGIAFASGADLAASAAGIQLVGAAPRLVTDALDLSRRSLRVMRENFFWAFCYNIVAIPLAASGRLPPEVAVAAMMCSSLAVVLNSLRLRRFART